MVSVNINYKKTTKIIFLSFGFLLYWLLGGYITHLAMLRLNNYETAMIFIMPLFILLIIMLTYLLNIAIHTLGHYIAGKHIKFKLLGFQISIFSWMYENGKLKLVLTPLGLFTGLCNMLPQTRKIKKSEYLCYHSGGIIANLIFLIFSVLLFCLVNPAFTSPWFYLFSFSFLTSLFYFLLYIIPYVYKNRPSDGKIIFGLLFNTSYIQQLMLLDHISSYFSHGPRPKDCIHEYTFPLNEIHPQFRYMLAYLRYQSALDAEDFATAKESITIFESRLDCIPLYRKQTFYYELIYFYSAIEKNEEKAKKYYSMVERELLDDSDINGRRVLAAYEYYINHNKEVAIECLAKAIVVADQFPLKGQLVMEKELILKLQKDCLSE